MSNIIHDTQCSETKEASDSEDSQGQEVNSQKVTLPYLDFPLFTFNTTNYSLYSFKMSCSVHPSNQPIHSDLNPEAGYARGSPSFNPSSILSSTDKSQQAASKPQPQPRSAIQKASMKEPKLSNRGQANCEKVSPFCKYQSDFYSIHPYQPLTPPLI